MSRITRVLVATALGVLVLCFLVCWRVRRDYWPVYFDRSGQLDGYSYSAIWRDTRMRMGLETLIVIPRKVEYSLGGSSSYFGGKDTGCMIYVSPTFLKVCDEVVDTSVHRMFVFSDGNDRFAMLPIELTDDEIRSITPESIDALPGTEMWKEKIEPVLKANEGKRKPTGNRHGELFRGPRVSIPNAKLNKSAPTIK